MQESQASEQRLNEARDMGEDWATNFSRPQAMVTGLEDYAYYTTLIATTLDSDFPRSYMEAKKQLDLWQAPMKEEMEIMKKRGVFKLVPRPKDQHVVGLKWGYVNKYNVDGEITRWKARLVAQGFTQIPGLEYDQTYALVARLESLRMVVAIAAHLSLHLWQIYFVSVYLNSDNKFLVYMEQPPGFVKPGEEDMVNIALKTIYGMMNGAYDWSQPLKASYNGLGYYELKANPCICHQINDKGFTLTGTYTDDVFGALSNAEGAEIAKNELANCYDIKDMGEPSYILRICIDCDKSTGAISLSQQIYLERVLK